MQFCRKVLCQPCSARVTSPEEDMEYKMGSCIGISLKKAEGRSESVTQSNNRASLTGSSSYQHGVHSQPLVPDVPVITGVEESRCSSADQDDKEELEFPHDLLPSLDFSSELNIWESSLGRAHCSSGERKVKHHVEVYHPAEALDSRPHGCDPLITDVQPTPQPVASPQPGSPALNRSQSMFIDQELQEAIQECEEQMASLGMLTPTPSQPSMSEKVNSIKQKTGSVKESNELPPPPPVIVQPGASNKSHGKMSTHGNSEGENSQKDTVVFSFRDYILGMGNSAESETKAAQGLSTSSEIRTEKGIKSDELEETSQQTTDLFVETTRESALNEHRDVFGVGNVLKAIMEENDPLIYSAAVNDNNTDTITASLDIEKECQNDDFRLNSCKVQNEREISENESPEGKNSTVDSFILSEQPLEAKTGRNTEFSTYQHTTPASDKTIGLSKETKKRKRKKKKKSEKDTELELKSKTTRESSNGTDAGSLIKAENHTDSPANEWLVLEADSQSVISVDEQDNKYDHEQGKLFSPKSSSSSMQDPLLVFCTPESNQKHHQSDNHSHMKSLSPQMELHVNLTKTGSLSVPIHTTVIETVPSTDSSSDTLTDKATDIEAKVFTRENQSLLSHNQTCVGAICLESASEQVLLVGSALPLATLVMPEVIETKGERVSEMCDSVEREATVSVAESEKREEKNKQEGREDCKLLGSPPQLPIICLQEKYSLASLAKEGEADFVESYSSKMPHSSTENEIKGLKDTDVRTFDAELSRNEEGDIEKESLRTEDFKDIYPLGLQPASDATYHHVTGSERIEAGSRGEQEVDEIKAVLEEHSSCNQPEGSAGGLSSVETEVCPSINVAESQFRSQDWSERLVTTADQFLFLPCQEQHNAPRPAVSEDSSSNTKRRITAKMKEMGSLNKEQSLGQASAELPITEVTHSQVCLPNTLTSSRKIPPMHQASGYVQVQPGSSIEAGTFEIPAEIQGKSNSQSSSTPSSLGVRERNRVHFADNVMDKRISVDLTHMLKPALNFASLPPLTVYESLQYPIVEASYTFPEVLSLKKKEVPTIEALIKDKEADPPKPQEDFQLKEIDTKTGDSKEKSVIDSPENNSLERTILDVQSMTEACSKQPPHPENKNQTNFIFSQTTECADPDVLPVVQSDLHEGVEKHNQSNSDVLQADFKVAGKADQSTESPLTKMDTIKEEENNQFHPSNSMTSISACKPSSDISTGFPASDTEHKFKQDPNLNCPGFFLTQPYEPCHQPMSPDCELNNEDLNKVLHEQTIEEIVTALTRREPCVREFHPLSPILEDITNCDTSLHKQIECNTDGNDNDVTVKVVSHTNVETTQVSLPQDLACSVFGSEMDSCRTTRSRNEGKSCDVHVGYFSFTQEENQSLISHPLDAVGLSDKRENICEISQHQSELDLNDNKCIISKKSISTDVVNSPFEANKDYKETKDDINDKLNAIGQSLVVLFKGKKEAEEPIMNKQMESADSGITEKISIMIRGSNKSDKEAVEEFKDLQVLHHHNIKMTESPLRNVKKQEHEEVESQSEVETTLFSSRTLDSLKDNLQAEVKLSLEPKTVTTTSESNCNNTKSDLAAEIGQLHTALELKCVVQQQEQQQHGLGSSHYTEQMSLCLLEEKGGIDKETQALVQGATSKDKVSAVDLNYREGVVLSEKNEFVQEISGVIGSNVQSKLSCTSTERGGTDESNTLDDRAIFDEGSQVGETREELNEKKSSDVGGAESHTDAMANTGFMTTIDDKSQQKNYQSGNCQSLFRKAETSTSPAVFAETTSQMCENSQTCGLSQDHTKPNQTCTGNSQNINLSEEISSLDHVKKPETIGNDGSKTTARQSNISEIKEPGIQDTLNTFPGQQNCNKTPVPQNSPDIQPLLQGLDIKEVNGKGVDLRQTEVIDNDATEKQGSTHLNRDLKTNSLESIEVFDHFQSAVSHISTEAAAIHTEDGLSNAAEEDKENTNTTNVVPAPSASLCQSDILSTLKSTVQPEVKAQKELLPKLHRDMAVNLHACHTAVEQRAVNREVTNDSKSPTVGQNASTTDTNWITTLREAQTEQQNPVDTSRPFPSLESPQLDFLTPTEEVAAPQSLEVVPTPPAPPEQAVEKTSEKENPVKRPVDLPEPLKKAADLPEPTQHRVDHYGPKVSAKVELLKREREEPTKTKEERPDEIPEADRNVENLIKVSEEPDKNALTKRNEEEEIVAKNEKPEQPKTPAEDLQPEKKLASEEELVGKPGTFPPVQSFTAPAGITAATETVRESVSQLKHTGPPFIEQSDQEPPAPAITSPPTSEPDPLPDPPHLHRTTDILTASPAPAETCTPEDLPSPPDSSCHPLPCDLQPASPPAPCAPESCPVLLRSSDSDGAFETPESTTPVKASSPTEPQRERLSSDSKVSDAFSDPTRDSTSPPPPSDSFSGSFDENRPIAASGTYNIDFSATGAVGQVLTRSLSLQGGDLGTSNFLEGSAPGGLNAPSESFSVGTESAPGTLHRTKKVRSGSLKKKTLLRQNSNPESPRPALSSSTPEVKKRAKPRTASPLQAQEESEGGSATQSPGGTLRRTRRNRVESPPPLPEETSQTSQVVPTLPLCQEELPLPGVSVDRDNSPIPPSGSYKWDPENFDKINPFQTGGSKIANSPILGRKDIVCPPLSTGPESPPGPSEEPPHPAHFKEPITNPEEQPILPKREPVRLEFDYSEESCEASQQASPLPKKVGKKPSTKMPLRKPKLGLKKAHRPQTDQLDNNPQTTYNGIEDVITVPQATYNLEHDKWEDQNFNPFISKKGIGNSPRLSRPSYDPNNFDDSIDPFKSSNKMSTSPPVASSSFEMSSNDYDNENDNIGELGDQNQNKPTKKKKTPIKSNTFRVKRSPKKSPQSDPSEEATDEANPLNSQDDHATDEEKLASSTSHKWAALHNMDAELNSDKQDFPEPCDLTSFVNENSLPQETPVQDYEIAYMEKIGSSSPPISVNKPSLYLKLDSVSDNLTKNTNTHGSEPNSPCTGSFEEMEAQITAGMKTPVLSSRPGPEGSAGDKGRKRESEALSRTQSIERDEQPYSEGPMETPAPALAMLDRLSECDDLLQYLEPDLAETNPTAFAQKLQEELVLAALRIEALQVAKNISQCTSLSTVTPQQQRDLTPSGESAVAKNSLYARTTITAASINNYIEGESPHLPKDLDHSLGIAREEIVSKEKEVLEWQRKYEDSRQEVVEMRRIVAEYEKTIAQMIGMPEDDQKEKSLSHHTIQQLIGEKDQALADLNSVEKSLADLFRRYEKMKDVLDGFRKNEEVLKRCAQEYLSRVRKEEQRYQALKIHAEEKLDKANSEIAQVRLKAKQEQAAYQASMRKEQMKVDSLERTLEQKNKEIEELTKICDELIAKMGKS
ncbi:uncharacterized protein tacc2 isoform X8 [Gouania willdenowi]|uniref:uncharacterized protein tacc2 isoform X8 n=1 Tax=Gouania willdenowi TaxID=441366 RepID=UPI0010548DD1|nr:uncharacterized protein LOC114476335 isoform X8 [Gouania willdenowi]